MSDIHGGKVLPPVIGTYSGGCFRPLDPDPNDVNLIDIAHALSMICRYTGHVSKFWSVGAHCYTVSHVLAEQGASFEVQLQGLLHDASEAYLVDLPRPIKDNEWPNYRAIEERITRVIAERFGVAYPFADHVKAVDDAMIPREVANFFRRGSFMWDRYKIEQSLLARPFRPLLPMAPEVAEEMYLARFDELVYLADRHERTAA